ncbi:MAG TPA: 23S rRNA (pseudouridine(1915)-N(3))-methyltransferase RlmH [Methanocorpusculum sp.]|nr:23S rRNA (pseudouridine(1915)-N(3))-methyltransferase RlmH [Methanocorpusculum sp.]
MQIQILCVGRIKDSYLNEGIAEFSKRLRPYATVSVTELSEVKSLRMHHHLRRYR